MSSTIVPLSKGYVSVVDDTLSVSTVLSKHCWYAHEGQISKRTGRQIVRAVTSFLLPNGKRRLVQMGHVILGTVPWHLDGLVLDHINRDALDNRQANLRLVTQHINNQNREFTLGKGVTFDKERGQYMAYLTTRKVPKAERQTFLGRYNTYAEAESVVGMVRRKLGIV